MTDRLQTNSHVFQNVSDLTVFLFEFRYFSTEYNRFPFSTIIPISLKMENNHLNLPKIVRLPLFIIIIITYIRRLTLSAKAGYL